MAKEDTRLVVTFENFPKLNESLSKEAGRPIFEDLEICRIRMSGDRLQAPAFPAHAEAPGGLDDEDGYSRPGTYAEKYPEQYARFKKGEAQTQAGTPLEALPFLTPAKTKELKGLNIYTAEALAALDGQNLKTLGQGGRDWKNQAQAYLDNASGSAAATRLATENEYLKQQLEELRSERAQYGTPPAEPPVASEYETFSDDELKAYIKLKTQVAPRGNPSHSTLVAMAEAIDSENK